MDLDKQQKEKWGLVSGVLGIALLGATILAIAYSQLNIVGYILLALVALLLIALGAHWNESVYYHTRLHKFTKMRTKAKPFVKKK